MTKDNKSNTIKPSQDKTVEKYLKIIEWATGDDTGASSNALCRFMLGLTNRAASFDCPSDADDRGRCIRLLNLIPEWWDRLDEMAILPSVNVNVFTGKGIEVREQGWKEQIPLIRKEANK